MQIATVTDRRRLWMLTLIWVGVIFLIGSSHALPMRDGDVLRLLLRKSIHLAEYAVLGWLLSRSATNGNGRQRTLVIACALATAMAVGGLDEWHQTFVPGRHGTPWDVLLDTAGAGLGILGWASGVLR